MDILYVYSMYNKSSPTTSLASYHGTHQFMKYLSSMKKIEDMIRAGSDIQAGCDSGNTGCTLEAEGNQSTAEIVAPSTAPLPDSPPPGVSQRKTRFAGLKFKANVRARGRPKRPVRQLCSLTKL